MPSNSNATEDQDNERPAAGKRKVTVIRRCLYTHRNGVQEQFFPGDYTVPEEVANDPWFAHHTTTPPENPLPPPYGTVEYTMRYQGVNRLSAPSAEEEPEADASNTETARRSLDDASTRPARASLVTEDKRK